MGTSAHDTLDVVAIGNAIVDVITHADDGFLHAHDLVKGAMTLVDADRSAALYEAMPPAIEASGGSAANTTAGVASFGGRAGFVGKIRNDVLGEFFSHDIRSIGIEFTSRPAEDGPPTARSLIIVTPDAQRTMNTCLGIAGLLHPDDVDVELVSRASIVYCEGYLWDVEDAKQAMRVAMAAAHAAGRRVALTLSDGFCVERHRDEFRELVASSVDILFANSDEIRRYWQIDDFDAAVGRLDGHVPLAFVTRGAEGAVAVQGSERHAVPAHHVEEIVDTTGAGDQFAAGVLYGLTHGYDIAGATELGVAAAAEVISHVGPRPEIDLSTLL